MSGKPKMFNVLDEAIEEAAVRQIIQVKCSFARCEKPGKSLLSLGYCDGQWRIYGLCDEHLEKVLEKYGERVGIRVEQKVFAY